MAHDLRAQADALDEVAAAADALAHAQARRLAAVQSAFDAGANRDAIAERAKMTRAGVYKLIRSGRVTVPRMSS